MTDPTALLATWSLSNAELGAMGFPVRMVEKSMGNVIVLQEGTSRSAAELGAFFAGKALLASPPAHVAEDRISAHRERNAREAANVAVMLAELRAAGIAR